MLKQKIYKKGKQILTVEDLKEATSTLFLSYKHNKDNCFCIDNPVGNQFDASGDDELIDFWLTKGLQTYDIYERLIEDRASINEWFLLKPLHYPYDFIQIIIEVLLQIVTIIVDIPRKFSWKSYYSQQLQLLRFLAYQ